MFIIILAIIFIAFIVKAYNLIQEINTIYYKVGKNFRNKEFLKVLKKNTLKIFLFSFLLVVVFFILYLVQFKELPQFLT